MCATADCCCSFVSIPQCDCCIPRGVRLVSSVLKALLGWMHCEVLSLPHCIPNPGSAVPWCVCQPLSTRDAGLARNV